MKRLLFLLAAALPASATIVVFEDFSTYTAGLSLSGQNGGSGWSGAWSNDNSAYRNFVIATPGLTYPGLASSGKTATGIAGGAEGGNAENRNLPALSTTYGSVLWVAFEAALSVSSGGFPNLRFANGSQNWTGGIGGNDSYENWTLLDSSLLNTSQTTTSLDGNTHLALLEIDYGSTTSTLWMDPLIGGVATPSATGNFAPVFDRIDLYLRAGDRAGLIRVATTSEEALGASVPEPGTALLAGLALASLGFSRWRRRA